LGSQFIRFILLMYIQQDMIQARDKDLVTYEGSCFRCSKCWLFKWPWRFPEKQPVSMRADDRLCQRCITQGKRTALLRESEGLPHDKILFKFDSKKIKTFFLQRGLIGAINVIWDSFGHEEGGSEGAATALQPGHHAQQEQRLREVCTKEIA